MGAGGESRRWCSMTSLKEHKYLALLIVLVGALIVQSLHPALATTPATLNLVQTIIVVAVFLGVFEQRRTRVLALWLGIVTAVLGWSEYALPADYYPLANAVEHSLRVAFLGFAAVAILGDIFKKRLVRADDVLGAACGYFLAGIAWSNLFQVCEIAYPGSFSFSTAIGGQLAAPLERAAVFNYFSFATLTTTGYGDITPLRGPATAFAMLETIFGQFYVAVLVAQLVGIRLAQAAQQFREQ
jgi:voltage-gated potassium channel